MNAEVPYAEVDGFRVDDFNECVLADEELLLGHKFEPVTAGQGGGVGLCYIRLRFAGVEQRDVKAIDDTGIRPNVNTDDDVVVLRELFSAGLRGSAAGIDCKGGAAGGELVVELDVEDGVRDVKLNVGALTFDDDDLVGGGTGVDEAAEKTVTGLARELTVALREGDKVRGGAPGVEAEDGVFRGEAEAGGNLGREFSAGGFLFEELGVNGGCGSLLGRRSGVMRLVVLFPELSRGKVNEGERNLFRFAATLSGDVADAVSRDGVAHDELIGAVFEDQARAAWRGVGGLGGGGFRAMGELGGTRRCEGDGCAQQVYPPPAHIAQSIQSM